MKKSQEGGLGEKFKSLGVKKSKGSWASEQVMSWVKNCNRWLAECKKEQNILAGGKKAYKMVKKISSWWQKRQKGRKGWKKTSNWWQKKGKKAKRGEKGPQAAPLGAAAAAAGLTLLSPGRRLPECCLSYLCLRSSLSKSPKIPETMQCLTLVKICFWKLRPVWDTCRRWIHINDSIIITITMIMMITITMISDLCEIVAVIDEVGGVHPVSRSLDVTLLVIEQRQFIQCLPNLIRNSL